MSNDAKEYVVAEFKRNHKQIEELKLKAARPSDELPSSWYEHEQAFVLVPQYQKLSRSLDTYNRVEDHYRQQLIAIKEGDDWQDLTTNDQGEIVTVPRKADAASEVEVSRRINAAAMQIQNTTKEIQTFQDNHKKSALGNKEAMVKLEDDYFPQYKTEESVKDNKYFNAIKNKLES